MFRAAGRSFGGRDGIFIKPRGIPIAAVNVAYLVVFGLLSVAGANYEFLVYAGVIVVFFALVLYAQRRVRFSLFVLWGLTLWGMLHMAGGHLQWGGQRLYELVLIDLARKGDVTVLRYDHLVHMIGFGVSTLVCFHLLRPYLGRGEHNRITLSALVVLMGMGMGALNELVELIVVLVVPQSGVGGYFNTAFDLLFNTVGASLAVVWLNVSGNLFGPGDSPGDAGGDERSE